MKLGQYKVFLSKEKCDSLEIPTRLGYLFVTTGKLKFGKYYMAKDIYYDPKHLIITKGPHKNIILPKAWFTTEKEAHNEQFQESLDEILKDS